MEAKVTVFNNEEFGEVRTVTIDGEPWFVGKDVAEKLGYANINKAVAMHIDEEDKKVLDFKGFSQNGNTSKLWSGNDFSNKIVVNESGLYSLIFGSKLESAKRFKHWVTDEVLPCIRKNGIYATDNVIDNILNNPDFGIELLTKLKEERAARIEAEKTNAILMHVNKTYTMTEIAKEIGLKSANELNKILAEKKIQYKSNGTWVMYSDYSDLGYESIKQETLDSGHVIYYRRITQLGRKFILGLFDMAA
jgi:prophage antirepressor-like protein|nr:MAG TPA: repressor domain protein [Bacteriophage sp.]